VQYNVRNPSLQTKQGQRGTQSARGSFGSYLGVGCKTFPDFKNPPPSLKIEMISILKVVRFGPHNCLKAWTSIDTYTASSTRCLIDKGPYPVILNINKNDILLRAHGKTSAASKAKPSSSYVMHVLNFQDGFTPSKERKH
jgi:hypothetical protein